MRLHRPDRQDLAFFEDPQQQELGGARRQIDFIEEQGALVRLFDLSHTPAKRSGWAGRFAHQQAFKPGLGQGGAGHRHERPQSPTTGVVNGAGHSLLPGAGLALDEDVDLRISESLDRGAKRFHRST